MNLLKSRSVQNWIWKSFVNMDILDKIKSFGDLPEGWDFGRGIPASKEVVEMASRIHIAIFDNRWVFDTKNRVGAFPCDDGGMVLCYSREGGDDFIVLRIRLDLKIDLDHEKGIGSKYDILFEKEGLDAEDFGIILGKLIEIGVLGKG